MFANAIGAPDACPPELRSAYEAAATEAAREDAATALARHFAAVIVSLPRGDYGLYLELNAVHGRWHQTAADHRARRIAERVPDPYARPVSCPRDAACRHLWAYRAWSLANVLTGGGGGADPTAATGPRTTRA